MTPSRPQPGASLVLGRGARWVLTSTGAALVLAATVATFVNDNGLGTAALVGAGALAGGTGLVGRWPSRLALSGSEISWEDIRQTVDSQIEVARGTDEPGAVEELRLLRQRLDDLERGRPPTLHPAEVYDAEVRAALTRVLPSARVRPSPDRSQQVADLTLTLGDRALLVETKWKQDAQSRLRGSTLPVLLMTLAADARLLVVTNAGDVTGAAELLAGAMGPRGAAVTWRDERDDADLAGAAGRLLAG